MGSASREEQWLSGQESPVKCVNCFDDKYTYIPMALVIQLIKCLI